MKQLDLFEDKKKTPKINEPPNVEGMWCCFQKGGRCFGEIIKQRRYELLVRCDCSIKPTSIKIDRDIISIHHTKLEARSAHQKYIKDASSNLYNRYNSSGS